MSKRCILQNVFSIGLLLFLSLPLISQLIPTVNATFAVTEQSDRFVVENDYFIAHIPNSTSVAGAGTIAEMYIKPQTSINIVSHTSGFCSLIGAEFTEMNGTNAWSYGVWGPSAIHSLDVSKVAETQYYATIRSEIVWRTSTWSSAPNHTLTIYMTFYNQPYYIVTLSRTQEDNYTQIYNSEICFLFDNDDFWDKDDTTTFYASNRSGYAVQGYSSNSWLHESSIYGKFPWIWVYNETMGVGHGTVLVDSKRPSETNIGNLAGGSSGSYSEYQINTGYAERINEPLTLTFISYARGTTDYSYIDNLATQLYESRKTALTSDDYDFPLMMNYKHNTASYNKFGRINFRLRPIGSYWGFRGWDTSTVYWQGCNFYYVNATGSYNMFNWAEVSVPTAYQNGTYATVTWNRNYKNKLNWTSKFEVWDDSDTMKITMILETESSVNITKAYWYWFTGSINAKTHIFDGEPDYLKLNASSPYLPSIIKEEAYLVKNLTNTEREIVANCKLYEYWVKQASDVEYSSGETWTMEFYVQYFKRYVAWDTNYVDPSDFRSPTEHDSNWDDINYQNWVELPLFNQVGNLSINRIGQNASQLAYSVYADNILTIVFAGDIGGSATHQIYCGMKGKPTSVSGASSWSYNATSKILTIGTIHNSSITIAIAIQYAVPDVAITSVTLSKTVVGGGYPLSINVTMENQGDNEETFNITAYYNETAIILPNGKNYTTVTLPSGNSTTITFTWITTGVVKGNYTISAFAIPVPFETDTDDNAYTDGTVLVTIPGDVNGDKLVDIYDLSITGKAYASVIGEPRYNPEADITEEGLVDMRDLAVVGKNYGKVDP